MFKIVLVVMLVLSAVYCLPVEELNSGDYLSNPHEHSLWKRFINPSLSYGNIGYSGLDKIRTKRSLAEECEKLQLCKLHARSSHSFLAAFQLYFVNKENARLWDHTARSSADCERRFSCYR